MKSPFVARVKVPVGADVPRFVQLPNTSHFVPLEQIIAHNLDLLFPGEQDFEYRLFLYFQERSGRKAGVRSQ